jgi:hypothetical protein
VRLLLLYVVALGRLSDVPSGDRVEILAKRLDYSLVFSPCAAGLGFCAKNRCNPTACKSAPRRKIWMVSLEIFVSRQGGRVARSERLEISVSPRMDRPICPSVALVALAIARLTKLRRRAFDGEPESGVSNPVISCPRYRERRWRQRLFCCRSRRWAENFLPSLCLSRAGRERFGGSFGLTERTPLSGLVCLVTGCLTPETNPRESRRK